ncbi:uncharacterized protein LOC125939850 [Dermacentor silvarum]|uniref:uncharacterized protein LOC125939850 n=1 Tax=Dermacentor silvarum TaxID=543639 RepID=UPI002101B4BF|nr:uncharacterized protein LOC125939850 [Dermacentor silvarum]
MLTSPAKEELSNAFTLTCGPKGMEDKPEPYCCHPELEELLRVIKRYLNFTHLINVTALVPLVPDDVFPAQGTYSWYLTHGVTDIRFAYVAIKERRAFSVDFLFPLDIYRLVYLYPSPSILKSDFTVLKIFSVTRD